MILHDWSPAKNLLILQNRYDALPSGGEIIITLFNCLGDEIQVMI
jgi:hypothetical protein